jgi:hypothetical protein
MISLMMGVMLDFSNASSTKDADASSEIMAFGGCVLNL